LAAKVFRDFIEQTLNDDEVQGLIKHYEANLTSNDEIALKLADKFWDMSDEFEDHNPDFDDYALAIATKAHQMGSNKAYELILNILLEDNLERKEEALKVIKEALKRDQQNLGYVRSIYHEYIESLSATVGSNYDVESNYHKSDELKEFVDALDAIIKEHSPGRGLKFTWERVTDPELMEEAKAALADIDDPNIDFSEDDIYVYELGEAVAYIQEQRRIADRRANLVPAENSPTYEEVKHTIIARSFSYKKIDPSSTQDITILGSFAKVVIDPRTGYDVIVTSGKILDFAGAEFEEERAFFPELEAA